MANDNDYGISLPGKVLPPEEWARTALKKLPPAGPLDWAGLFGRSAPVVLDLGCGNGRFLVTSALRRPELNHLGTDILPLVIRYATRRANQRGLHHARLAVCGAYELLKEYVAPHSVQEIHLYHPQPHRDDDSGSQRLLTPEFLALAHRALAPDGLFVVQTDNQAYWQYFTRVAPALFELQIQDGPWPDAPRGRTRREIYALQHKMTVQRAQCRPRSDRSDEEIWNLVNTLPLPKFAARQKRKRSKRRK